MQSGRRGQIKRVDGRLLIDIVGYVMIAEIGPNCQLNP